jgi:hypothetical protein
MRFAAPEMMYVHIERLDELAAALTPPSPAVQQESGEGVEQ